MPLFTHILVLATIALVALSSFPAHANALAAHPQAARHIHDAVAKRRRDASSSGTCIPRPSTSLSSLTPTSTSLSSLTPTSTPTPTPSTTAAPPPSATSSGSKKMALAWADDDVYIANFALSKVGYLHNWTPNMPTQLELFGLQGIPMLWDGSPERVVEFQSVVVEGYAEYAGAINEPDQPSQANMLPEDAAHLFVNVMLPLKKYNYTILGPACTDSLDAKQWYLEFEANCTALDGCGVDYTAVHVYNTDVGYITDYLIWLHTTFSRPVIVLEAACQDFSGANNQAQNLDQVLAFAEALVEFTDTTEWMVALAPYGIMEQLNIAPLNQLIDTSTHEPTTLGYRYFS